MQHLEPANTSLMETLRQHIPGVQGPLYQVVAQFEAVRETRTGTLHEIDIKIYDCGHGRARFFVEVSTKDGKVVRGDGAELVTSAIARIYWGELD